MKEELLSVMREFYHDGIPEGVVPRDVEYVEKLRASTVVKGMRRTGKTFVTYERMKRLVADGIPLKRIVHINFEDERLSKLTVDDLHLIGEVHAELCPEFADGKVWYFLDELQCVDGWESYARRLVDSPNVQLCLTGSSSKLLSEEIATQMRGRSLPIEVFPLSFPEYLRFNGILSDVPKAGFTAREKGVLRKAMSDYAERGGFPDVQDVSSGMRAAMLQEYVDAVLYRDIIERHKVASVQALKYTLEYLFHNYARKTSTRSISGVLKNLSVPANRESVADYLDWFKDAYLVYPVSVLSDSLAVKRVNPDKYYLIDSGLIRAMCVKNDAERGWMLENIVYMALRRGGGKISYIANADGTEVDFHVLDRSTHGERLVQVSYAMSDAATFNRETNAIKFARQKKGIHDCTIVTWDDEGEIDGIRIMPVWKWLLA
ncbi:MAG: ATP-binding protein [Kiritimatiellae bacterium]|nr:ATP-binding protein [Kiritimatiellia bacterium]